MCASYDRLIGSVYIKLDENKNILVNVLRDYFTLKSKAYNVYICWSASSPHHVTWPIWREPPPSILSVCNSSIRL
jgi:hypothetical protein